MRKLSWFEIVLIVSVIFIAIYLIVYQWGDTDESFNDKAKRLNEELKQKIQTLEYQIWLKQKIYYKACMVFHTMMLLCVFIIGLVNIYFINRGFSPIETLEGTCIILGSLFTVLSLFVYRQLNFNRLVDSFFQKVLSFIYQWYGYSQSDIPNLQNQIIKLEKEIALTAKIP